MESATLTLASSLSDCENNQEQLGHVARLKQSIKESRNPVFTNETEANGVLKVKQICFNVCKSGSFSCSTVAPKSKNETERMAVQIRKLKKELKHEKSESARKSNQVKELMNSMEGLKCPITFTIPKDPVVISSDNNATVYESSAILKWVEKEGTSPLTRNIVTAENIVHLKKIGHTIQRYKACTDMFRDQTDNLLKKMVGCRIQRQFSVVTPKKPLKNSLMAVEIEDNDCLTEEDESDFEMECEKRMVINSSPGAVVARTIDDMGDISRTTYIRAPSSENHRERDGRFSPINSGCPCSHDNEVELLSVNLDHTDGHVRRYRAKTSMIIHSELKYFKGLIVSFDSSSGKHVHYDDGSIHHHQLSCDKCSQMAKWNIIGVVDEMQI